VFRATLTAFRRGNAKEDGFRRGVGAVVVLVVGLLLLCLLICRALAWRAKSQSTGFIELATHSPSFSSDHVVNVKILIVYYENRAGKAAALFTA